MKHSFSFSGISIAVRNRHLTPKIHEALSSGRYENAERNAIQLHVNKSDRVLDLGGGIGCTGVVAGKIVGGKNLMIIEPNGDLITDINNNLIQNDVMGANLVNAAVVPGDEIGSVDFYKSKGFWSSSLIKKEQLKNKAVQVRAVPLSFLVERFNPTVVICDTEGIEAEIFSGNLSDSIRLLIIELHPNVYDQDTIKEIFDRLSEEGFSYSPRGSRGAVVCFERKKAPKK